MKAADIFLDNSFTDTSLQIKILVITNLLNFGDPLTSAAMAFYKCFLPDKPIVFLFQNMENDTHKLPSLAEYIYINLHCI